MSTSTDHNPFFSEEHRAAFAARWAYCKAEMVLTLLRAKEFSLTPEQRTRIETCQDLTQLETWATRLLTADTLDDMFRDS